MSNKYGIQPNIYQLSVSFLGMLLMGLLTFFPPAVTEDFLWRKPIIGSIFSIICLLGILAVFSPKQCFRLFNFRKKSQISGSDLAKFVSHGTTNVLEGHHLTCGKFSAHIFQIRYNTFCAACTGLLLGGFLALAVTGFYFFCDRLVFEHSSLLVFLGIVGVSFGLFQFKFRNFIRLFLNSLFVLGGLSILIGIDELVRSLVFDLFVLCLIIFWLFTRISLSQWDHKMICFNCGNKNCRFREDKKRED